LRFFVDHDNTDYDLNPSRGYQFKLQYSKDFEWGDSKQSWDFLELKYNHYLNLPTFSFTQQNVLAMSFWSGYSFSWDRDSNNQGIDAHRPPPWEGGKLGGMFRMRGYNSDRFSDKSVIYGTAEYRAILDWNPFRKNDYIPVAVDWLQVVGFVEAGNVNDKYNTDLFEDMKFDVGISLRAMAAQVPVRVDVAYGDEGVNFWVMVFQPFDF
jgi:outer membrane protein assembly factor BamA